MDADEIPTANGHEWTRITERKAFNRGLTQMDADKVFEGTNSDFSEKSRLRISMFICGCPFFYSRPFVSIRGLISVLGVYSPR
jgi:hypothetical protein